MKKDSKNNDKFHYLYYIENQINGKLYIGITINSKKRWANHLDTAQGGPEKHPRNYSYIHKAINKYGKENFIFNVYDTAISKDEANEKEIYWIAEMRRMGVKIYNLTDGGDGISGYKYTEEELQAMSYRMKGKMDGEKNPFYGKTHTNEAKKILSENMKRRHQNKELIGEKHSQSKLTDEKVLEIRRLYEETDITQIELANKFSVTRGCIQNVLKNKVWTHLELSDLQNQNSRQLIKQNVSFDKKFGQIIIHNLICEFCSKDFIFKKREFATSRSIPRFCCKQCKNAAFGAQSKAIAEKKRNKY